MTGALEISRVENMSDWDQLTSKNFGTTISPWVVLPDALRPFRTPGFSNDVELVDYLREVW